MLCTPNVFYNNYLIEMSLIGRFILSNRWLAIAIVVWAINYIFGKFPLLAKAVYADNIYQVIRWIYTILFSWIPVPCIYLLVLLLFFLVAFKIYNYRKAGQSIKYIMWKSINFLAAMYALFYLFWGFNYAVPNIAHHLGIESRAVGKEKIISLIEEELSKMMDLRREQGDRDFQSLSNNDFLKIEAELASDMDRFLTQISYKHVGKVRIRRIIPEGVLLRTSTAGIYIPYVFEGHIDAGLHGLVQPFTALHEMGHGFGIADEGECNFIAYQVCSSSSNSLIAYSGRMGLLRYLLSAIRRIDKVAYLEIVECLDVDIKKDIYAINEYNNRFPDILPKWRDAIYDQYLQANGIESGLLSYDQIIVLKAGWDDKFAN